ncbi:MAG: hypothetical protein HY615_09120 [Candidatus Rokubacteria bacterium]|nr:hypothetical protein [Candidatus Rokubacteria bacterium]
MGVVLAALSLVVMPALAHFKRRVATRLAMVPLIAREGNAPVTWYLSVELLGYRRHG